MQYQITSDNIELSPSMEVLAKEKMKVIETKLKHVYDDLKSFRIVMNTAPTNQFQVKIHAVVHGKEYFTDETSGTLEHALITAINELEVILGKARVFEKTKEWQQAREAKRMDPEKAAEQLI